MTNVERPLPIKNMDLHHGRKLYRCNNVGKYLNEKLNLKRVTQESTKTQNFFQWLLSECLFKIR